jgi:fused signal recognition particle receptor
MSETEKRSLFGRMFGGGKTPSPAPAVDEEPAGGTPAGQVPAPAPVPEPVGQIQALQQPAAPAAIEAEMPEGQVHAPQEPAAASPLPEDAKAPEGEKEGKRPGWFQRLKQGLTRTTSRLTEGITSVFTKRKLDDDTLEELEDLLIQADLGLDVAASVTAALKKSRYNTDITSEEVRAILAQEVEKVLAPVARPLDIGAASKPHVVLMVGVNGTGKTTTIGKYASQFTKQGLKVMLAAGDTFRAAAIEQLKIWGERTGSAVVSGEQGADAAGLAFDACRRAKDEGVDVLFIDTAGRLQNKAGLMAELEKVIRVIKKIDSTAPHSVVLTLDATTGQNALSQVEIFGKVAGVTGLVMTKLDGTARGGILVAISSKYALPVHAIGVGEGAADLQAFQAQDFARAIAGVA